MSRRSAFVPGLWCALAACTPASTASPAGGTRLYAHVWESTEGTKIPIQPFQDMQLGIDCALACDDTGTPRCLPTNIQPAQLFADSACTQPVAGYTMGTTAPDYITVASNLTATCPLPSSTGQGFLPVTYYTVGKTVDCSNLYSNARGPCQQDSYASGSVCIAAGSQAADSTFVAFTMK